MSAHPLLSVPSISNLKVDDYEPLLASIIEHERLARFTGFTADNAFELGSTIRSLFLERYAGKGKGIVIKIELFSGYTLFSAVVGGSPPVAKGNWGWADAKFNVVKTVHKSSLRAGRELASYGKEPEAVRLPFPEFACHGGGFPLWIKGVDVAPIGAILVSGLPQLEDHQLIVDAIAQQTHILAPADK